MLGVPTCRPPGSPGHLENQLCVAQAGAGEDGPFCGRCGDSTVTRDGFLQGLGELANAP